MSAPIAKTPREKRLEELLAEIIKWYDNGGLPFDQIESAICDAKQELNERL